MRALRVDLGTFELVRAQLRATPLAFRLHRLHAVLLVARGLSCRRTADLLGVSPRSVENWVNRYNLYKYNGLKTKKHTGRRPRLTGLQLEQLRDIVAASTLASSLPAQGWNGPRVRAYIARCWGVKLGLRRAQALLAEIRRAAGKKYA